MKVIVKVGIGFLLLGLLSFIIAASLFTYQGPYNKLIVDLGEATIMLWIPLILIGAFLVVAGVFIDQD